MMPKTIYLQWYDDGEASTGDVTWCDTDIKYIRADIVDQRVKEAVEAERGACHVGAKRVAKKYIEKYSQSRLDPEEVGMRQYYDGASDAAMEIAEAIQARNTESGR